MKTLSSPVLAAPLRWFQIVVATASVSLSLGTLSLAAVPTPVKIMPLGDSITAGYTNNPTWGEPFEFGYRGRLARLLLNAGYPFQFVGKSPEPFSNTSGDPTRGGVVYPTNELRDPDINQGFHRGYGGYSINQINAGIATWIQQDDPDVILLMIGTNGISSNSPAELNRLVGKIFSIRPKIKLVVAQIIPTVRYNSHIVAYNRFIRTNLVPHYRKAGRAILTVDQYRNFLKNPADYGSINTQRFSNGINHPTNAAYQLMASSWLPAITTMTLTSSTVPANIRPRAGIATIRRLNRMAGETLAYTLVAGNGADDNSKFSINSRGQLIASTYPFGKDPAGKVYSVRVQARGNKSGTTVERFRIVRGPGALDAAITVQGVTHSSETAYAGTVQGKDLLRVVRIGITKRSPRCLVPSSTTAETAAQWITMRLPGPETATSPAAPMSSEMGAVPATISDASPPSQLGTAPVL